MTKAQQLLDSPDFNTLAIEIQNRLLMQAIIDGSSTVPASAPTPIVDAQTIHQQGVVIHQEGQPFLLVPLPSDPTGGIQTPVSQIQPGPGMMDVAKSTLGTVGDGLKNTLGLGLGLVGAVANLAVDVVTLGQSRGTPPQIGK